MRNILLLVTETLYTFKNFAHPHQTHLSAWTGPYHGQDPLGLKNNLTARFSLGMGVCSFDWTVTGTDVSGKRSVAPLGLRVRKIAGIICSTSRVFSTDVKEET